MIAPWYQRAGFGALILAIALLPDQVSAQSAECAANMAALDKLDAAIEQLDRAALPARLAGDMTEVINQLIEGLKATQRDLGTITDPVNAVTGAFEGAREKFDTLTGTLREMNQPMPRGWDAMTRRVNTLAEDVARGIERYKNSAPGKTAEGLDKAAKFIGGVVEKLESVKTALQGVKALDDARNGTGAEQIRAMKYGFDQLKGALAIDEVPGLGAFLDAYSEAMDGIANSVETIERTLKERIKMANEALRDSDFGNVDRLYPGLQSPREKKQAHLESMRAQRAALQARREADGCDRPPPQVDVCADPKGNPDKMRRLIEGRTRGQQETYDRARQHYGDLMSQLGELAFAEPRQLPSAEERDLGGYQGTLDLLRRAARANDKSYYGRGDPLDGIPEMARVLGVTLPAPSRDWSINANRYVPLLSSALAKKKQEAEQRSRADLAARTKAWQDRMRPLTAATKAAAARAGAAKQPLDNEIGNTIAREANAKQWTKAQTDQFDECFPRYASLRMTANTRLFPPARPAPTAQPTKPAQKNCRSTGGLAGALNKEACEISR